MIRSWACPLIVVLAWCGCVSPHVDVPSTAPELQAARLFEEGKYKESLQAFREVAADGGRTYVSLMGIARCHAFLGNRQLFEMYAIQAAGDTPATLLGLNRVGSMYVQGAERFRSQPSSDVYARLGLEYLRRVYALDQEYPNIKFNLGLAFYLAGEDVAAARILEESFSLDPGRFDVAQILLMIYRRLNKPGRAKEILQKAALAGELPGKWDPIRRWAESGVRDGGLKAPRPVPMEKLR